MSVELIPCQQCDLPSVEVHRGADGIVRLVVRPRHHGRKHVNIFTLAELIEKMRELERSEQEVSRHN